MNDFSLNRNVKLGGLALIPFFTITCAPAMLSGIIGWRQIKVVAVIKKAYSLWRSGSSVRAALSAATGGWGWVVSLIMQFGIAYAVSQAFQGSWLVSY